MIKILRDQLLPAYRAFHRDLLWHQSDRELWRPLFIGRAFEAILSQGAALDRNQADRRPARSKRSTTTSAIGPSPCSNPIGTWSHIAHERVRPIPLYIKDVGVAPGVYQRTDRAGASDLERNRSRNSPASLVRSAARRRTRARPAGLRLRPPREQAAQSSLRPMGSATTSTTAATTAASCCSR